MKHLKLFACIALLFAPVLSSQQGYVPFATEFDGTSDFYLRGADLTGNADGKVGTASFWFRLDGGDGLNNDPLFKFDSDFSVVRLSSNIWRVFGRDTSNVTAIDIRTITTYTASPTWQHFIASFDTANGLSHLYVDDGSDNNEVTNVDLSIDYTGANWVIGATTSGTSQFNGALSEFYFALEYLDLSVEANRRKFITADGKPVDLGPGCHLPTGTVAIICMQTQFNGFGQNSGSGGDFAPQDPTTWTAGPVPILQLPGRAAHAQARGRGGRGGRSR